MSFLPKNNTHTVLFVLKIKRNYKLNLRAWSPLCGRPTPKLQYTDEKEWARNWQILCTTVANVLGRELAQSWQRHTWDGLVSSCLLRFNRI